MKIIIKNFLFSIIILFYIAGFVTCNNHQDDTANNSDSSYTNFQKVQKEISDSTKGNDFEISDSSKISLKKSNITLSKKSSKSFRIIKTKSVQLKTRLLNSKTQTKKFADDIPPEIGNLKNFEFVNSSPDSLKNISIQEVSGLAILPISINLSKFLPFIGNQGTFAASCSGWATAYFMTIRKNLIENNIYTSPGVIDKRLLYSPYYLFNLGNKISNAQDCSKSINLFLILNILRDSGIVKWDEFDYSNPQTGCFDSVSHNIVLKGLKNKITVPPNTVPLSVKAFQNNLANKTPILLAINYDQKFWDDGCNRKWSEKKPFVWNSFDLNTTQQDLKGHAVVCVGYNDELNAFLMTNSWGNNFGNGGFFWIDYDFALSGQDGLKVITETYIINSTISSGLKNIPRKAGSETYLSIDKIFEKSYSNIRNTNFSIYCTSIKNKLNSAYFYFFDKITKRKIPFYLIYGSIGKFIDYHNKRYVFSLNKIKLNRSWNPLTASKYYAEISVKKIR